MRAHLLEFLRQADVVLERILVAPFVENVAGVANRRFADGVGALYRLHGHAQIGRVVQRIEDAENIHARLGGVLHESGDDVVGIVGVPDRIGAAEEHLETHIGNAGAQLTKPFPRILVEEAHGGVEGRAAPHFEGEQTSFGITEPMRQGISAGQHVVAANARGHQRLVRVTERRIGHQQTLLLQRPLGEFPGSQFEQQIPRTLRQGRTG